MTNGLSYKTKQFFFVLIKLSIVAGTFYFIYQKLTQNEHLSFSDFSHFLEKNKVFSLKNILFLLFLTVFNWFFEILKWQKLASIVTKISFLKSLEQSLGALTASLFTPNRIGEYGAKAVYFQYGVRKKIMLLNLLGNMSQMAVTTFVGIFGLLAFYATYKPEINPYQLLVLVGICLIILLFARHFWRNNSWNLRGFELSKIKAFIKDIAPATKTQVLLLATIRYFLFSLQFYFLLILFQVNLNYYEAMVVISCSYLLSSIIPSIFIFDVVVKGGVAVFLFSFAVVDNVIVLSTITFMWLLNFVLPSIFGSYYVLNFNLAHKE